MDDSNTHIALMKLGGVRRRVGVFRSRHHKWFDYLVRPKRDGHDTFSWLYPLLQGLGIRDPNLQPKLFPPAIDFPSGLVGISLGASVRAKQWPTDSFERLVDLLNLPCIGFAGPGQEDLCPHNLKLAQGLDHPLKLAAAIGQCRVLVTADSGPAHIAAAMGTPAVVLYGPTDSVRFAPFGTKHTLLREANTCDWNESVCIDAKNGVCQQSCMRAIRPEVVAQAVLARIKTD